MKAHWEDVAARARGLTTHLLRRADLEALAAAPTPDALAEGFRAHGLLPAESAATPDALEGAVRHAAGTRLRVLSRWADRRDALLAVIFGDEDRRSVRAFVRGAQQHAPPEERLAGLIPTRALPERALVQLAGQPSAGAVAALLTAWGHPYGPPLLPAAAGVQPNLLTLEHRVNVAFAAQALRGGRAAGSRDLLDFVRETIDLENACAALVLATTEAELQSKELFLAGGRRITLATFLDAIVAREATEAGARLAAALRPTAFAAVFERAAGDPGGVERALLRHRIAAQTAAARRDPAGIASVLNFALRVRAEVLDLARVVWGVMLRVPRNVLTTTLVSA